MRTFPKLFPLYRDPLHLSPFPKKLNRNNLTLKTLNLAHILNQKYPYHPQDKCIYSIGAYYFQSKQVIQIAPADQNLIEENPYNEDGDEDYAQG